MNLPRDIIFFSTADWNHPVWTNNQHMAVNFAQQGFRVLYIESLGLRKPKVNKTDASRILKRIRNGFRGLRKVDHNIWVFSPVILPFHDSAAIRFINAWLIVLTFRALVKVLNFNCPIVWTYNPLLYEFVNKLQFSLLVYHCVDDLSAVPGIPPKTVKNAELSLIEVCDLIFTTSQRLQQTLSPLKPGSVHYFPNVADFDHFSTVPVDGELPEVLNDIPQPRIGFVGSLKDYKVDFNLIADIARIKPEWHWVLIGDIDEESYDRITQVLNFPNIHLLGSKPYAVLPAYMRGFNIATLPCLLNQYTCAMFPMKFFEYLAAGIPVVSTPLAALDAYSDFYLKAVSADEFIQVIEKVLLGQHPGIDACRQLAQENTWRKRTDSMLQLMGESWAKKNSIFASKRISAPWLRSI